MLRLHQHRLRRLLALFKCVSVLFRLAFLRFLFLLFPIKLKSSLQLLAVLPAINAQRGDCNAVALVGNLTARRVRTVMVSLASD